MATIASRFKLNIRFKLLLGFLLLVCLASLVQAFSFIVTKNFITAQTDNIRLAKAQFASEKIADFIDAIEVHNLVLARAWRENPSGENQYVRTVLSHLLKTNEFIKEIIFLAPSGREIIRMDINGQTPPEKLSIEVRTEQFDTALAGTRSITKVYYAETELGPYIDMFYPVFSERNITIGVIKMHLSLGELWDIISQVKLGESGFAYVVDGDGVLIAHPDQALIVQTPQVSSRKFIHLMLYNITHKPSLEDYVYTNEKNIKVVARASKISNMDWLVVFEQPTQEAYGFLNFIGNLFFLTLGGSLFLLICIAVFLSNNLTYGIQKLRAATKLLEKGRFDTFITIQSGDEIESLAMSFNQMAKKLHESILTLKKDRDTISAERNKLAVVLSGVTDGVIAVDLQNNILIFNTAAERITGYLAKDVIGKPIEQIMKVFNEERELSFVEYCPMRPQRAEGIAFARNDIKIVGRNSKECFVNFMSGHIKEQEQANVGCIITLHDVSRERFLEIVKADFVTIAAHQLRTPLSELKWAISLLLDGDVGRITRQQKEVIEKAYQSNERMIFLVNDLLNVARIEEGKIISKQALLDVLEVIQVTLLDFWEKEKAKKIKIIFKPSKEKLPKIFADEEGLKLVIQNLIANAIQYTNVGGLVTISAFKKDHDVTVSVQDNGIGIPEHGQARVFTKFFRAENALRMETQGSGLGLFIAKNIVEGHGGRIWFESKEGQGTTFYFTLPIKT